MKALKEQIGQTLEGSDIHNDVLDQIPEKQAANQTDEIISNKKLLFHKRND